VLGNVLSCLIRMLQHVQLNKIMSFVIILYHFTIFIICQIRNLSREWSRIYNGLVLKFLCMFIVIECVNIVPKSCKDDVMLVYKKGIIWPAFHFP